ncbi:MAG: ParB/RepB/Spo0J family partition protein [Syntrophales bacterium]|nr:ParB/RepB/Spo0J family partition protein [Syntrophales bacterium]
MPNKNDLFQAAKEYQVQMILAKKLVPTPENPRDLDPKDPMLMDLAQSIRSQGILVPLLARPHPKRKGLYDLRAGARRLMAANLAGLEKVPVIVRAMSDQEALEFTVTENLQRESLTPLEEAKGIDLLISRGWKIEDVASNIGKTVQWAYRRARLTHLSDRWRKAAKDPARQYRHWPASNLELVARLDPDVQDYLLKAWDENWQIDENTTAAKLDRLIADHTHETAKALWSLDDTAIGNGQSCAACNRRSSCRPTLFDEITLKDKKEAARDRCLDPRCWNAKLARYTQAKASELKAQHGKIILAKDGYGYGDKPIINVKDENVLPERSIVRSKAKAAGAVPVLLVSGPKAGTWAYGKVASSSAPRESKPKEESKGDPLVRQNVATAFALAQVALTVCLDPGDKIALAIHATFKLPAVLACLDSWVIESYLGGYRDRYANAQEWLRVCSGLGVHVQGSEGEETYLYDAPASARLAIAGFDGPAGATIQDYVRGLHKGDDLAVNLDRLTCFGVFAYFITLARERDTNPFAGVVKVPEDILKIARDSFAIPRMMLDCHQKADLLAIGRDLGIQVTTGMRREAIIEKIMAANLPPGTLTSELKEAFGLKRTLSDMPLGEIRDHVQKAGRKARKK